MSSNQNHSISAATAAAAPKSKKRRGTMRLVLLAVGVIIALLVLTESFRSGSTQSAFEKTVQQGTHQGIELVQNMAKRTFKNFIVNASATAQ